MPTKKHKFRAKRGGWADTIPVEKVSRERINAGANKIGLWADGLGMGDESRTVRAIDRTPMDETLGHAYATTPLVRGGKRGEQTTNVHTLYGREVPTPEPTPEPPTRRYRGGVKVFQ